MRTGVRAFVLLFPYGTADGVRAVYSGRDRGRAAQVVADYKRAGWGAEVHRVDAGSFAEAMERLARRVA